MSDMKLKVTRKPISEFAAIEKLCFWPISTVLTSMSDINPYLLVKCYLRM